ncbi:MAG TPA: polyprenyl synthetase family protein [Deferrisomatales bacterium]|nr:polyprenyl synthetase family protein [Deferrisomatales bacterium]
MDMSRVFSLMDVDLQKVERQFEENLRSDVSLIPAMGKYVLSSGGKRIRPLLLLLAARMCGYRGERAIPLASIVEFIHTATLLHDDVVDNANLRRGQRSANEVWGNSASVLVGDFLFTKSFSLLVADNDLSVLKAMSDATTAMAEGEVLQLLKTCDLEISEDEYLEVVINKTAVLIAAACEIGGLLGGVGEERTRALQRYGLEVGIAFQLMDDCLDYVAEGEAFGKAVGTDLNEGKITLPLIHAMRHCSAAERAFVQGVVEREEPLAAGELLRVQELIGAYDGIEFTREQARRRIAAAKAELAGFPACPEREALQVVADYVVTREK